VELQLPGLLELQDWVVGKVTCVLAQNVYFGEPILRLITPKGHVHTYLHAVQFPNSNAFIYMIYDL